MTIAVSAVVRPSRLMMLLVYFIAVASICTAFILLFGNYQFSQGERLHFFTFVTISAVAAIFKSRLARKTFHIDISGIGQIRLTQYSGMSGFFKNSDLALDGQNGRLVHLCPDSTLWPQFLLLRLKTEHGAVLSVPVLVDSVSPSGFAALSVACRYIAARTPTSEIIDQPEV